MQKNAMRIAMILVIAMILSLCACTSLPQASENGYLSGRKLSVKATDINLDGILKNSNVLETSESISENDKIDVIVETAGKSLSEAYAESKASTLSAFAQSEEGKALSEKLVAIQNEVRSDLERLGLAENVKHSYTSLINGFSATIRYGDLDAIRALPNVNRVVISALYSAPDTVEAESIEKFWQGDTGILFNTHGYNGEGMVVAVVDSAVDFTHPAFSNNPENPVITYSDIEAIYESIYGFGQVDFEVSDLYRSAKIPFTFDYANMDTDTRPTRRSTLYFGGDHGTHVSGIIVGDNEVITGSASKAQLIGMKVFKDNTATATTSDIIAALGDAAIIGVDAINLSLGSPCGFTYSHYEALEYVNEMYDKLRKLGIGVCASAGNSYNASYINQAGSQSVNNPEYGVLGSPSSYDASFSVASCEAVSTPFFTINGTVYNYGCSINVADSKLRYFSRILLGDNQEVSAEIVPVGDKGVESAYEGIDVNGKIALVQRGGPSFSDKARFAASNGAIGLIVYNTADSLFNPAIESDITIPVASLTSTDGSMLLQTAEIDPLMLTVSASDFSYPISDYSSWGPVSDLTLKPDITAPGGNIFSSVPQDSGSLYNFMSGTSMSSPNLTGAFLSIKQYIKDTQPSLTSNEMRTLAYRLMMSTATQLFDENGRLVSPRHQGAGLVNIDEAIATKAYISVVGSDRTKLSLGDDKNRDGIYTLNFNIVNFGDSSLSYEMSVAVLADGLTSDKTRINNATYALNGNYTVSVKNASLDGNTVTVEAGKTASVKVVITLNEEDTAYLMQFPNGTYVEGYCVFESKNEDDIDLSVPYLAFYGDFTEASAFDKTIYETTTDYYIYPMGVYGVVPGTNNASTLGTYNLFAVPDGFAAPAPSENNIAVSTNPDSIHTIYTVNTSLLRDVELLEYEIRDVITGEIYYSAYAQDVAKNHYSNGSIYLTSYGLNIDFTDLPATNNQQLEIVTRATLTYNGRNKVQEIVWPLFVDSEAPSLIDAKVRYENDKTLLDLTVFDNHVLQCIGFGTIDRRGENVQAYEYSLPVENWKSGKTNVITLDMTDYLKYLNNGELIVNFTDYALNSQAFYVGSILPENQDDKETDSLTELTLGTVTANNFISVNDFDDESADVSVNAVTPHKNINVNGEEEYFLVNDAGVLSGYVGPAGDVVIPSDIGVKSIAGTHDLFRQNTKLTSIVIPEGVTEIQNLAFFFCTNLTKIVLPSTLESIGANAINSCYKLESINLQDTDCKKYGNYAISNNLALKELIFPNVEDTALTLGYHAMGTLVSLERLEFLGDIDTLNSIGGLPNLKTLIFHGNVEAIYGNSFMGCTKLSVLEFRGNVGQIGDPDEFYDTSFAMHKITTLDFMGDVGGIYSSNFTNCPLLEKVTFHGNVEYVSGSTFTNCTKVTEFTVAEGNDNLFIDPETRLMFNKEKTLMMKPSAWDYDGIITVPETVTELVGGQFGSGYVYISDYSLVYNFGESFGSSAESASRYIGKDYSYKLKGVILHDGITNLPTACFNGCVNIETIDMSFVEADYLSDAVFANCTSLKSVALPEGICEFGEYCFYGSSIKEVSIPEDVTWLPNYTFRNCTELEKVEFNNVEEIYDYCFTGASSLKEVIAPCVYSVGEYAFMNCTSLENVEFSEDICDIYSYTFADCTSLKNINLTDSMESVYTCAFANTTSLEEIYFSENMSDFGDGAFMNSGLRNVTLNNDLYVDISNVFYGLKNLESFEFSVENPYYTVIDGVVYDKAVSSVVLFPTRLDVSELTLPETVVSVSDRAFMNAVFLKSIDLGKVIEIGNSAFENSAVENADISGVEYIGKHAFRNTHISEVTLSSVNRYIGYWAFADNALEKVTVKADAHTFNYTFIFKDSDIKDLIIEENYKGLRVVNGSFLVNSDGSILYGYFGNDENVILPEGITVITADAFKGNASIVSVVLPSTLKAIGDKAFYGCTALKTIEFRSKNAPALYGTYNPEYNLCYANFVDYVEICDAELTAIVPDAEAFNEFIWNEIFDKIVEKN